MTRYERYKSFARSIYSVNVNIIILRIVLVIGIFAKPLMQIKVNSLRTLSRNNADGIFQCKAYVCWIFLHSILFLSFLLKQ